MDFRAMLGGLPDTDHRATRDAARDTEHETLVQAWRQARERRLRADDGWLTLVDRILLEPGDNALPFGLVTLDGDEARLRVHPGLAVTSEGRPVADAVLHPREGERSQTLSFDGRTYELYRRGDTVAVRVKDPRSPALRQFTGLSYFAIDAAWRVTARFQRYVPPRTTVHQLDVGPSGPRQVPGLAHFSIAGMELSLEPILEEDAGRLFIVFADRTTGKETSPAGRFLYVDLPGPDDAVVLDFNLAFNPPCAFTAFATCPIPPARNRLPVAVTAGEKDYHLP